MRNAFEQAFVEELRDCLEKLSSPAAHREPPPGMSKSGGVPSELARIYETIGPTAAGVKALKYVTPRMDAHLVGRAAAKLNARHKMGIIDLAEKGQRSATKAKSLLPVAPDDLGGAAKLGSSGASPLASALRAIGTTLSKHGRAESPVRDPPTSASSAAETDGRGLPGRSRPQAATSSY